MYDIYRKKHRLPIDKIMDQTSIPDVRILDLPPLHVRTLRDAL